MQGCVAEVAVSNDLGVALDEKEYESGDPGWDIKPADLSVDVKSTSHDRTPKLLVTEGSVDADVYLCVHVSADTVTFLGSAWANEVKNATIRAGTHQIAWNDLGLWPSGLNNSA